MGQIQREIDTKNELRRALEWYHLIGIGLGATIGMGIFNLSGQAAARYSGPSVIISFIFAGIIALLAALSLSELTAIISVSGSVYTYTYAALGEYAAWFIGWNFTLLYQMAALTVVVSCSTYVVHFIESISSLNVTSVIVEAPLIWDESAERFFFTGQVINLPAIIITFGIVILLFIGILQTAIVNLVLVVIKIIILLIFIFACCKYVDRNNYTPFIPSNQGSFAKYGMTGILQACSTVFFAYGGFDVVATMGQETWSASRSLPLAIIASLIISMLIYIGICTVMVGLVPYTLLNTNNPLSEAIKATPYSSWLMIVMDFGGITSMTTVALTVQLSQNRIFYAMAHDGLLPPIFAKIYSRTKTPWLSIIISGIFCSVFSGILPVDIVGDTTSLTSLITYLFIHINLIVMRYTHRDISRNFKVPFGNWIIPTLGSLLCILLITGISKATGFRFLTWTILGQIIYFSYGFWHSKRRQPELVEIELRVQEPITEYTYNESESNLNNETIENKTQTIFPPNTPKY